MATDLPMERIAEQCGFGDESYLGKVFRRRRGQTLREFRRWVRITGRA